MKERTQYFGARAYPTDVERLRQIREQLQQHNPERVVSMADVLRLAVQSASAVMATGDLHVSNSLPPLRLPGDSDRAA